MNLAYRCSILLSLLAAATLTSAAPALAADPWLPEASDTEGVYIISGTGPPNTRVDLVQDGTIWNPPHRDDTTLNEGEYTSSSGQFRIDEGFCNPGADCIGGDEDLFRVVFYRFDLGRVPVWAPGSFFRAAGAGSQALDLPEVEDVPREDRVVVNVSGPGSLPGYTTISGTTRIIPAGGGAAVPLTGVTVDGYTPGGRGRGDLAYAGDEEAFGVSQAGGIWSMKVPPGEWALKYRTDFNEPFYPGYIWSGCIIEPSPVPPPPGTPPPTGTVFVSTSGATTGIDLTLGPGDVCNGSVFVPPGGGGGGGNSGGGGGGASDPPLGGGGPPAGENPISAPKATSRKDGTATVSVTVPGPGKLTATATGQKPKASAAKKFTIAKASATAKKAGTVKLVLKPTKAAKKLLKKGHKLKATAKITFKPTSGTARTVSKKVTFKVKKKAKKGS